MPVTADAGELEGADIPRSLGTGEHLTDEDGVCLLCSWRYCCSSCGAWREAYQPSWSRCLVRRKLADMGFDITPRRSA